MIISDIKVFDFSSTVKMLITVRSTCSCYAAGASQLRCNSKEAQQAKPVPPADEAQNLCVILTDMISYLNYNQKSPNSVTLRKQREERSGLCSIV